MDTCLICFAGSIIQKPVENYQYSTPLGVVTIEGTTIIKECEACHEQFIHRDLSEQWDHQILGKLSQKLPPLAPNERKFIFSALPHSQRKLAMVTGKDRSTLTRYKTGHNPIDALFEEILRQIIADFLAGHSDTMKRLEIRRLLSRIADQ